jgi:trans-aconitate methyltransferase
VIATDASPAMLEIARETVPDAEEIRRVTLPDDPIPEGDAIVSIGHVLSYLPDEESIERALVAAADALRPGGVFAIDLCDLSYTEGRADQHAMGWAQDTWAIVTETSVPAPDRYVRQMAIFTRNEDGTWRRDDERHDNVMVDTSSIPALLAAHGVDARVGTSFGTEELPSGLHTIIGTKRA